MFSATMSQSATRSTSMVEASCPTRASKSTSMCRLLSCKHRNGFWVAFGNLAWRLGTWDLGSGRWDLPVVCVDRAAWHLHSLLSSFPFARLIKNRCHSWVCMHGVFGKLASNWLERVNVAGGHCTHMGLATLKRTKFWLFFAGLLCGMKERSSCLVCFYCKCL